MKNYFLILLLLLFCNILLAQKTYKLEGYIKAVDNKDPLIGATISISKLSIGTTANLDGYYSLNLIEGEYQIKFSFIGYKDVVQLVSLKSNQKLNIDLAISNTQLKAVEIDGESRKSNVESIEMSVNKIDSKTIKKIPALLGEADVIKSILLLPGVSTVGEGSSGFNVRGGGVDQNLVLMDDAPIYNSSHLFGFFSVFNPDAIEGVKLIKGGIAPKYGGRLSSILDIEMKKGNTNKIKGSGGLGVIFSKLTLEGPIVKDKVSFVLGARRSYADILAKPFLKNDLSKSKFYFYDVTGRLDYKINAKNNISLSGYYGKDIFGAGFQFDWGNTNTSLKWNHLFNDKLLLTTTAFYSDYDYAFGVSSNEAGEEDGFNWGSSVVSYSVKPDFSYYLNDNNTIKFGFQSIYYHFKPAEADFTSSGTNRDISLTEKHASENGIYIQNEQKIGSRLSVLYGLRWSYFVYLGPGDKQTYRDTVPGIRRPLESIEFYDKYENIADYHNLEPRLSIKFDLTEFSSVKTSYNRMTQNLHLISNTVASTPLDIWLPTSNNIKPQIADQIALGYFRNFKNNTYETSIEIFGKKFQNQIDYIDNAEIFFNDALEGDLLPGNGRAYGLEVYLKKNKGDFTGWLSYTLSHSERKVEGINRDDWYPNRFDRLHNLSLVGSYRLNEKWSFSANFVYSSGTPATFPTNRYEIQGIVLPNNNNSSRNNYRIPAYHRLDISATLLPKKNKDRRFKGEWVFSVYNVYNRRNPFAIFFEQDEENPQLTRAIKYSIIGNFVPAVSYNFKF